MWRRSGFFTLCFYFPFYISKHYGTIAYSLSIPYNEVRTRKRSFMIS